MRILLDLHILPGAHLPSSNILLIEIMMEMARRHTGHSFIFLAPESSHNIIDLPVNVRFRYVNRNLFKWLGKEIWYKHILPKELAGSKADLFVTADNAYFKKAAIPSCLFLIHSNTLLQDTTHVKKNKKIITLLNRAIKNADNVITFSKHDKQAIQKQSPASANKIKLLRHQATEIAELKWTEKEMIKIEFAGGVEYFVFAGDIHERYDLIGLLKAFTLFKKWQQSNMKLLLVGNKSSSTVQFSKKLSTYKYRNDVHLLIDQSKEDVQRMISGAYAFVYPALYDPFPVNILQAMKAGVPVITTPAPVCREWGGNAVMYPETNDIAGFAKSMQLVYKDEKLRSGFVEAAKKQVSLYEKNDMVEACLNFLKKTLQSKSQ
ncbi:MAG: glycosyltransferase [Chitinophagaceae bacterium]